MASMLKNANDKFNIQKYKRAASTNISIEIRPSNENKETPEISTKPSDDFTSYPSPYSFKEFLNRLHIKNIWRIYISKSYWIIAISTAQITIIYIILECMHKDSRVKVYYNNIL